MRSEAANFAKVPMMSSGAIAPTVVVECPEDPRLKPWAISEASARAKEQVQRQNARTSNSEIRGSFTSFRMTTSKSDDDFKKLS
jgi:hypothetical protein